ncbi:glycoside hydrolase family 28 protein [Telluribacter sp.]|jgi:polygalacturonase|uniref:glycoside hydrolase family 28 protein n=1 Tax=Telluribacter sp. TaxID=1978767 RepID=UPI002E1219BB|nr:glycosyl hydrolase family 28 protein [Telluribacter sp.]
MMRIPLLTLALVFHVLALNAKEYNIADYGAERDKLSTTAIQKAIDAAFEAGGGTVVVPAGMYITGAIILKSRINLHLEQGAELQSSTNLEDFLIGNKRYGMIYCEDAVQVSITGKGIINGRGSDFYIPNENHTNSTLPNSVPEFYPALTRQKEKYMKESPFFTDGPLKRKPRPGMTIVFFHCNQVTIKDITIKDTPIWATRFGYCEDVLISGVSIMNNPMIPNSDGIHLTVSRNVRISDCDIVCGDDAIIVTGFAKIENTPGFTSEEQDKYKNGNKTIFAENIQVNNCRLQSRSSAIRIGYGQHPIRRCTFTNIIISESNRGIGIYAHDSSSIEELIFSNITIETRLHNGVWWGKGEPIHLSSISRLKGEPAGKIRQVQFNNISAIGEQGILVYAMKENPMEDIQFQNVKFFIRKGKETMNYGGNFDLRPTASPETQLFSHDIAGLYAQNVNNLSIKGFELSWDKDLPFFFTHGIHAVNVGNLLNEGFYGSGNPSFPGSKKVHLENASMRKP